jgi:hypothetical protein
LPVTPVIPHLSVSERDLTCRADEDRLVLLGGPLQFQQITAVGGNGDARLLTQGKD